MSKTYAQIALWLLCLCGPMLSRAQNVSAGMIASFSYSGLILDITSESGHIIDRFTLCEDNYGFLTGRTNDIGVRFSYTHEYVFKSYEFEEFIGFFHAGAGAFAGYVYDHEPGSHSGAGLPLGKEMGLSLGLAASVGFCIDFPRSISIDLSFSAYPGMHLRGDRNSGMAYISLYLNGLYQILYPRLSVIYVF